MLGVTGLAAWVALVRYWRSERINNNAIHLVLGMSFITLGLMAVTGEGGWELNHFELHLPPKVGPYLSPGTTPEIWSHVHMILNHFPTVGYSGPRLLHRRAGSQQRRDEAQRA